MYISVFYVCMLYVTVEYTLCMREGWPRLFIWVFEFVGSWLGKLLTKSGYILPFINLDSVWDTRDRRIITSHYTDRQMSRGQGGRI